MVTETVIAIVPANLFSAAGALPFIATCSASATDVEFFSDQRTMGVSQHRAALASASLINQILDARSTQSQAGSGRHEGAKAEKAVPSPTTDWVGSFVKFEQRKQLLMLAS